MKVIHIIPSAFDYFDDIRESAFQIIRKLDEAGIEDEVITLQYTSPPRSVKAGIGKATAGGRHFEKEESMDEIISSFAGYDVIHLHCPFLGAAGKILKWKQNHPGAKLLITYYRETALTDLMNVFISLYNQYYLPLFFKAADAVSCLRFDALPKKWAKDKYKVKFLGLLDNRQSIHLTGIGDKVKLSIPECGEAASRILFIYKKLTDNN